MKNKIAILALSVLLTAASLAGCGDKTKNNDTENETDNSASPEVSLEDTVFPGTDKTVGEILSEYGDSEMELPKGEVTEIWFDEVFGAYYPKQLKDIVFTKMYMYGELDSSQPVICLCSEKISGISVFSISDGKAGGEALYTVDELLPMEAIVLQVELSEKADIGISFTAEDGKTYSYAISRNADSSEVIAAEMTAE